MRKTRFAGARTHDLVIRRLRAYQLDHRGECIQGGSVLYISLFCAQWYLVSPQSRKIWDFTLHPRFYYVAIVVIFRRQPTADGFVRCSPLYEVDFPDLIPLGACHGHRFSTVIASLNSPRGSLANLHLFGCVDSGEMRSQAVFWLFWY